MSDTDSKAAIRQHLRTARDEHAAALPASVSALVFRQPPAPVREIVPRGASVGLYRALKGEAPAASYARFFLEEGHVIALPRIEDGDGEMSFRRHTDPFSETDLERGPFGVMQPAPDAEKIVPDVLFVPLLGFTERGERIGQGGGFYDRWLADHPRTTAIGLAWDVQRIEALPLEEHDVSLTAIVTPSRIYGPFA
ncbi:5-formyltetrahydrofolate cyclo-ligase [Aurantiacibacter spongiae]|uniref:5-formyltetrahydrofolate cyclo-ligase n=1 Tax=Aurantiacibacter spongiae TaxID=2488860 RepID=A0A3N5CNH5_9SPHN|nr:5-formyltetrahydrofolate cyclo-ligase [Aurantiacibacter spongiae]RPF70493.1 5-formyltetrahydrofolate cyclo-ligase [Aurantiacibacter spongiae]